MQQMSASGQGQTLTTIARTSALPLQADKLGGKRTLRFTMSDYGVTADSRRALSELRLLAEAVEKLASNPRVRDKRIDGAISANHCYQMWGCLESLLRRGSLKLVF